MNTNPQPPEYQTNPAQTPIAKPKKPWFRRWWVWALAVLAIFAFAGGNSGKSGSAQQAAPASSAGGAPPQTVAAAASQAPAVQAPAAQAKPKLTLDDGWAMDKSTVGIVYVNGYVTNNTEDAIKTYVQITFDSLDKNGANLGTCLANTNTIDAHGKWKFKAMCMSGANEIAKVRFKELTGF